MSAAANPPPAVPPEGSALAALRRGRDGLAALAQRHAAGEVHGGLTPEILASARLGGPAADPGEAWNPLWMSPEQGFAEPLSPASDVFSAGLILYSWIAGESFYASRPDAELDDRRSVLRALWRLAAAERPLDLAFPIATPDAVRTLVARACELDPAGRFPDAGALLEAVDRELEADQRDAEEAAAKAAREKAESERRAAAEAAAAQRAEAERVAAAKAAQEKAESERRAAAEAAAAQKAEAERVAAAKAAREKAESERRAAAEAAAVQKAEAEQVAAAKAAREKAESERRAAAEAAAAQKAEAERVAAAKAAREKAESERRAAAEAAAAQRAEAERVAAARAAQEKAESERRAAGEKSAREKAERNVAGAAGKVGAEQTRPGRRAPSADMPPAARPRTAKVAARAPRRRPSRASPPPMRTLAAYGGVVAVGFALAFAAFWWVGNTPSSVVATTADKLRSEANQLAGDARSLMKWLRESDYVPDPLIAEYARDEFERANLNLADAEAAFAAGRTEEASPLFLQAQSQFTWLCEDLNERHLGPLVALRERESRAALAAALGPAPTPPAVSASTPPIGRCAEAMAARGRIIAADRAIVSSRRTVASDRDRWELALEQAFESAAVAAAVAKGDGKIELGRYKAQIAEADGRLALARTHRDRRDYAAAIEAAIDAEDEYASAAAIRPAFRALDRAEALMRDGRRRAAEWPDLEKHYADAKRAWNESAWARAAELAERVVDGADTRLAALRLRSQPEPDDLNLGALREVAGARPNPTPQPREPFPTPPGEESFAPQTGLPVPVPSLQPDPPDPAAEARAVREVIWAWNRAWNERDWVTLSSLRLFVPGESDLTRQRLERFDQVQDVLIVDVASIGTARYECTLQVTRERTGFAQFLPATPRRQTAVVQRVDGDWKITRIAPY